MLELYFSTFFELFLLICNSIQKQFKVLRDKFSFICCYVQLALEFITFNVVVKNTYSKSLT